VTQEVLLLVLEVLTMLVMVCLLGIQGAQKKEELLIISEVLEV
jgi:hypothetical protein